MRERIDEALRLRIEEGLGYKEITDRTGVSKTTVYYWVRRHEEESGTKVLRARRPKPPISLKKDRGQRSPLYDLVGDRGLTRFQKGRVAEAAALLRISAICMQAFHAFGDGAREDIVVNVPGGSRYAKIQVKWAASSDKEWGLPSFSVMCNVNMARKGRRYSRSDFDFIVGYVLYSDSCYVYSFDDVAHLKRTVTVSPPALENWQPLVDFCQGSPTS